MSTRGLVGFVINGKVKASYNHCDSYPSYMGEKVAKAVEELSKDHNITSRVENIVLVDQKNIEPKEVYEKYHKANPAAKGKNWYDVLRDIQGDLVGMVNAGVMTDDAEFAKSSLFCEWAYLWNLDTNTLEVYEGFQKTAHNKGRFACDKQDEDGYFPVALVLEIPNASTNAVKEKWHSLSRRLLLNKKVAA